MLEGNRVGGEEKPRGKKKEGLLVASAGVWVLWRHNDGNRKGGSIAGVMLWHGKE